MIALTSYPQSRSVADDYKTLLFIGSNLRLTF